MSQAGEAGKQHVARLARDAFRRSGKRGVMIVHLQGEPPFKPRLEYNVMDTDDGSESADMMRELVNTYQPETQAVLYYHDGDRARAAAQIIDIESLH